MNYLAASHAAISVLTVDFPLPPFPTNAIFIPSTLDQNNATRLHIQCNRNQVAFVKRRPYTEKEILVIRYLETYAH